MFIKYQCGFCTAVYFRRGTELISILNLIHRLCAWGLGILILHALPTVPLFSQSLYSIEASGGAGVAIQFAKVINESFDAGPALNLSLSLRIMEKRPLYLYAAFDYLRSSFGHQHSINDAEASFFSVGFRFDLVANRSHTTPFLAIGAGAGSVNSRDSTNGAVHSLRNTQMHFGVGFMISTGAKSFIVPQIRMFTGETSALTFPLTCSFSIEL